MKSIIHMTAIRFLEEDNIVFELFQSHLRSVKKEIEKYSNSIPSLADYHILHSQRLQDKMQHPNFVISVAGTEQAGKSSFINALLGEDFIPNGTGLPSSTSTRIVFADHDDQVMIEYDNGESRAIKGNPLSYAFHQEMKNGTLTKDKFQFRVHHKLHALQEQDSHEMIDFVVIDTPSVDLDTSEEYALKRFKEDMLETDLLFYIFDASNPHDERTLRVLADIRPDLLEEAIFIVNKMDYRTTAHIDPEASIQDIMQLLQSFGIRSPKCIPVSAKTALYTRMIEKGMEHSEFYWQELSSYIREEELNNTTDETILLQSLFQQSGIPMIEQEIVIPAFLHLKEAVRYALQKSVMRYIGQMSNSFEKNVQKLSRYVDRKKQEKQEKEENMNQLISLLAEHHSKAEQLKEHVQQAAALLKKDELMRPFTFTMSSYVYHTTNEGFEEKEEAIDEARKLLALWIKKDTENIPEQVSDFYNTGLQFQESSQNYFKLLYDVARKEMARVNQVIYEYGLRYPKSIDFIPNPLQVLPHQIEIAGKRAIVRNMKMYDNHINVESYTTPYKDKVLLVFHKTKYVTKYKYDIDAAVRFAEKDLNEKITQFSDMYYEEFMVEKYNNYPKRVFQSAKNEIDRSIQWIEKLMVLLKDEMKTVDEELSVLENEITLITELQHRIDNRSKLITATERMNVANGENLSIRLDHATSGTTFFLDEGEFILHTASLSKSAAFVGKGKEKTKLIIKSPLSNTNSHDSFQFEDVAIEFDHAEDVAIAIDGYSLIVENCSILAAEPNQTIIKVSGMTEGSINNCMINGGLIEMSSGGRFRVSASSFQNNETAIVLAASSYTTVTGNFFDTSQHASIECKDSAEGVISDNQFSNLAAYGMICSNASKVMIENNEMTGAKVCAVFVTDEAKPVLSNNTFRTNKVSIILEKYAKSKLTGNTITGSENGILARHDSELILLQNTIEENEGDGVMLLDRTSLPSCKDNAFHHNRKNGISIGGAATGKIEKNQFDANEENGVMVSMNGEVWLVNNKMSNHGFAGVLCEGSSHLEMVQNEVSDNSNGVYLKDKASVEIEENTFIKNKRYGIRISDYVIGSVNSNECLENGLSAFWVDTAKEMEFTDNKRVESGFALLKPQYWNSKVKMQRSNQKAKRLHRK